MRERKRPVPRPPTHTNPGSLGLDQEREHPGVGVGSKEEERIERGRPDGGAGKWGQAPTIPLCTPPPLLVTQGQKL